MTDVAGFPIDWRLAVALIAILVAGIAKGVTGMGLPIAGVPILVALYGDLRMVLVVTILGSATADIPLLWRYRARYRDATMLIGFGVFGIAGIIAGTQILTFVRPAILSGVLALVVIAFTILSWLGRVPTISTTLAARIGPAVGLVCGLLQGSVGAAGPVTTSYLLSTQLSREGFLFAINATFFVLDWTQFFSLQRLGLTTPPVFAASVGVAVLCFMGLGIGFAIHDCIDDKVFRRGVLLMLGVAAVALITRAARG